jgi:hypothetical protein
MVIALNELQFYRKILLCRAQQGKSGTRHLNTAGLQKSAINSDSWSHCFCCVQDFVSPRNLIKSLHSIKIFSQNIKKLFFFPNFLLQVIPKKRKEGQNAAWEIGIAYIQLTSWRQVIQSTILSCSSPAPYQISILGHSTPAHTSSPGRMMDGKLLGNSFLLASSSLANHGG